MQYRTFGSLGWKASALGFGCMRLPTLGAYEKIDEPEAIRMIRRGVDRGVNYVDTAYGYHGGTSEVVTGKALRDGYRSRVRVATKLPPWHVKTAADFDRLLGEQLVRLQTDHIDLYLLHALSKDSWKKLTELDILSWAEGAIAAGKIGCLGFSFHDELPVFKQIIDAWDKWAFCQIMYNYLYEKTQAGTEGLRYAAARGIPVVVMEPLLGGNLINPPQPIQGLWDAAPRKRSPAEWALAWLWNRPEVTVVLSGMSTMGQVEDNLALADRSSVGELTTAEMEIIANARDTYEKLRPIPCTSCNYCMPCPHGVNIPHNLGLYNTAVMYNQRERERGNYRKHKAEEKASECTQCQECEPKCPQKIKISEWMPCIDKELGGAA
jgi:predicted aldo/keto reductase-like oxidoreductase